MTFLFTLPWPSVLLSVLLLGGCSLDWTKKGPRDEGGPSEAGPEGMSMDGGAEGASDAGREQMDACATCSASDAGDSAACPDGDGDSVCDDVDNCPLVSNRAQNDLDGDGLGFACDELETLPAELTSAWGDAVRFSGIADERALVLEAATSIAGCDLGDPNCEWYRHTLVVNHDGFLSAATTRGQAYAFPQWAFGTNLTWQRYLQIEVTGEEAVNVVDDLLSYRDLPDAAVLRRTETTDGSYIFLPNAVRALGDSDALVIDRFQAGADWRARLQLWRADEVLRTLIPDAKGIEFQNDWIRVEEDDSAVSFYRMGSDRALESIGRYSSITSIAGTSLLCGMLDATRAQWLEPGLDRVYSVEVSVDQCYRFEPNFRDASGTMWVGDGPLITRITSGGDASSIDTKGILGSVEGVFEVQGNTLLILRLTANGRSRIAKLDGGALKPMGPELKLAADNGGYINYQARVASDGSLLLAARRNPSGVDGAGYDLIRIAGNEVYEETFQAARTTVLGSHGAYLIATRGDREDLYVYSLSGAGWALVNRTANSPVAPALSLIGVSDGVLALSDSTLLHVTASSATTVNYVTSPAALPAPPSAGAGANLPPASFLHDGYEWLSIKGPSGWDVVTWKDKVLTRRAQGLSDELRSDHFVRARSGSVWLTGRRGSQYEFYRLSGGNLQLEGGSTGGTVYSTAGEYLCVQHDGGFDAYELKADDLDLIARGVGTCFAGSVWVANNDGGHLCTTARGCQKFAFTGSTFVPALGLLAGPGLLLREAATGRFYLYRELPQRRSQWVDVNLE